MAKRSQYWLYPTNGRTSKASAPAPSAPPPPGPYAIKAQRDPIPDNIRPEEAEFCQVADDAFEAHMQGLCSRDCGFCEDLKAIDKPAHQKEWERIRRLRQQHLQASQDSTMRQSAQAIRPNRDRARSGAVPVPRP